MGSLGGAFFWTSFPKSMKAPLSLSAFPLLRFKKALFLSWPLFFLFPRRGQRGNPLANGQNSSWVAKLTVDKTVGSSLTVLGSCRKTGASLFGDAWDR